jgi:drug/metabolite transporter (DMT)-like permease
MSVDAVRPRLSTPLLAALLCLVWSSAFVFVKLALRDASAAQFAALRVVLAVPPLFAALLLRDRVGLLAALRDRRVHRIGLLLGAVNVAGFVGLQTAGFELAGIGFGAVLIYAQPLLVAVLAGLLLGERLRPRQVLGLLTGWAGVGLAVVGEASVTGAGPGLWRAAGLFLGAAACFAVGTVVVKAVTSGPDPVPLGPALLLALWYGSLPLVWLGLRDDAAVDWSAALVVSSLYAGSLSLAGGYLLQFALLERGAAGVVSSYIFAVPVLAAFYGVVLFDEPLSGGLVLGAAAVAAGILLVTVPARQDRPGQGSVLEEVP